MRQAGNEAPLERIVDLSALPQAGKEIAITPKNDDLMRLAEWAGVDVVERFEAMAILKKLSQTRFVYSGRLCADVVQTCVVTLEPVVSQIEKQFTRELHLAPRKSVSLHEAPGLDGALAVDTDEAPEEIETARYDMAAPVLEEFVLSINPYPRHDGAKFSEQHEQSERPENPFAVLKRLATPG